MADLMIDRARRAGGNKKGDVYDRLVARLMRAEFRFGERILVKELAAELGVSRQPIMTALNRLDSEGFVRIIPQVGCEIVDPSPEEIGDFFMMFQRFEGLLAELAAQRRSDSDMRELKAVQRAIVSLEGDQAEVAEAYLDLNRDFHALIHRMARSPLIEERQRANFNMSDFFITHSAGFGQVMTGAASEHDAIIDAIERQAADRARAVAEVHIGSVAHMVLGAIDGNQAAR
jgi:DNA-binding GntR family transcriptional regulator